MSAPYLVIAGPTAVGKSELAVQVAERLGGEIVAADSRQVYRGIDVGTAKPTPGQRARVPHHLIDMVALARPYSAADYARDAGAALAAILGRGRVPVVCGGTGFYLEALAGGLDDLAGDVDPAGRDAARRRVEAIPSAQRHAELGRVDPAGAARLHPHDVQRVERALEVRYMTGRPIDALWSGGGEARPHVAVRLHRPRPELRQRIEDRLREMLDRGLEREARGLHAAGFSPADAGVDTIGYQEWWPHFEGRESQEDAVRRILVATRRYAKRQETWFRHRGRYQPVAAAAGPDAIVDAWAAVAQAAR